MPVKFTLDDLRPNTCHLKFQGKWTWNELVVAYDAFKKYAEGTQLPVYLILDVRETNNLPTNVLYNAKKFVFEQPENVALSILVNPNTFFTAVSQMMFKVRPETSEKYRFATTIEEAHRMIIHHRTLSSSS